MTTADLRKACRGNAAALAALAKLPGTTSLRKIPGVKIQPFRKFVLNAEAVSIWMDIRVVSEANRRDHWRIRAARAARQRAAVAMHFGQLKALPMPPVVVTLVRFGPRAFDDGDNLNGSFKHVRDEIARQFGVNDGGDAIEWKYIQKIGEIKGYAVRVEITRKP